MSQHIVNLSATGKVIADAETQACIILGAQRCGNMLKAVMSRIASLTFQAQCAERQCQVIYHYQHILQWNVFFCIQ